MSQTIPEQKTALRSEIIRTLAAMTDSLRLTRSSEACDLLLRQTLWRKAQSVLLYAPLRGELDIWPLLSYALAFEKIACLPRYSDTLKSYTACQVRDPSADLQSGRYGIREPGPHCPDIALNRLDLVLVPGVAFDLHGRRLGRGKGYYDKLLRAGTGKTCGVAFDEQVVREVPIEGHDVHLNCILTPSRWFELR